MTLLPETHYSLLITHYYKLLNLSQKNLRKNIAHLCYYFAL